MGLSWMSYRKSLTCDCMCFSIQCNSHDYSIVKKLLFRDSVLTLGQPLHIAGECLLTLSLTSLTSNL